MTASRIDRNPSTRFTSGLDDALDVACLIEGGDGGEPERFGRRVDDNLVDRDAVGIAARESFAHADAGDVGQREAATAGQDDVAVVDGEQPGTPAPGRR